MARIRTGQVLAPIAGAQFHERFQLQFCAPELAGEADAISRLQDIGWLALQKGRKAQITRPAAPGLPTRPTR